MSAREPGGRRPPRRRREARPGGKVGAVADLARERRIRGKLDELAGLLARGEVNPERTRAMLAGELDAEARRMDDDEALGTSIRLPRDLLARADALADARNARTGERASRSAVLRLALERGIAALEREAAELARPPTKAAILAELAALRARVEALGAAEGVDDAG